MKRLALSAVLLLALVGCHQGQSSARPKPSTVHAFASPQEAVEQATPLLKVNDWQALAQFYDLTGTHWTNEDLTSGRYFTRHEPPPAPHPGVDWHYKHPFTPGFKFDHVEMTSDPAIVKVIVCISIDQGGGMMQRGMQSFALRKTSDGWKLAPDEVLVSAEPQHPPTLTAIDFRPALAARFNALPAANVANLVLLLKQLDELNAKIATDAKIKPNDAFGPAGPSYLPLDEELLASEVGERISQIVQTAPPAEVEKVLMQGKWTRMEVNFAQVTIHQVRVVGSGLFMVADEPVQRKLMLPKRDSGF